MTTNYLVDTQNPTGYAQVVEELQGGAVVRSYTWGHWLLSQRQLLNDVWTTGFYGYDGHGSVRYLTDSTGAVTDTYDYDAFGNLISSTGTTPNNYLFAGEQYDPALGLYYNRARYLDVRTGRFWGMDPEEGHDEDPATLHKYLYAGNDPIDSTDRSGYEFGIAGVSTGMSISTTQDSMPAIRPQGVLSAIPWGAFAARDATSLSDLGLRFIAGHEGWSARHYGDADGNCTIGYGHLLHYGACSAGDLNNISKETGLELLNGDAQKATTSIKKKVKVPLAQREYDALVDFEFNTGALGTSSILTDLNDRLYATVPYKFMLYVYTHRTENGKRVRVLLDTLVTRRAEEGNLWTFGIYRVYGQDIGQLH